MITPAARKDDGSTLVVTISVVATILTLLGAAVGYTAHLSRVGDRSRKAAVATEIADGHLEYLFSNWRNIHRRQPNVGAALATNYFFTNCPTCDPLYNGNPGPAVSSGNPGAPPLIPLPPSSLFSVPEGYQVSQFRIQAVNPMIELDGNGTSTLSTTTQPGRAIGPTSTIIGSQQKSYAYLASVDVSINALGGTVTSKVRRVFEKKIDNPWTFMIFFNDDLELHPTTPLAIDGPIMTNGSLYISTSNFSTSSKVSFAGDYVNGYSPNDNRTSPISLPNFAKSNPSLPYSDCPPTQEGALTPWGLDFDIDGNDVGNGATNNDGYREIIEKPATGADEFSTYRYYNQADIKILIAQNSTITVYDNTKPTNVLCNPPASGPDTRTPRQKNIWNTVIAAFPGGTSSGTNGNTYTVATRAMMDQRESTTAYVRVASFDLSVIQTAVDTGGTTYASLTNTSRLLGDPGNPAPATPVVPAWNFNGIIYISDETSPTATPNAPFGLLNTPVATHRRAIRLINGYKLPVGGLRGNKAGLTIASQNPVYIQGNYNVGGSASPPSNSGTYTNPGARVPAAILADAVTVLSASWQDNNSALSIASRVASNTTVNCAIVAGIVPSASGDYSGGAENLLRLLEDWRTSTFCYYGSMVQLFNSVQGTGKWTGGGFTYKSPATSKWFYDPNLGSASPPGNLSLASYLQQQRWYMVY
jgi:hypothetical protein